MRRRGLIALLVLLCFTEVATFGQEIVVKLKPLYRSGQSTEAITNKRLASLLQRLEVVKSEKVLPHKRSKILDGMVVLYLKKPEFATSICTALKHSGYFEYAEVLPEKQPVALQAPSDPFADPSTGGQYYLHNVNAYKAWEVTKGDSNMAVCIVDNGLDWNHPEFKRKIKYNLNDPMDGVDNDGDGFVDNYMGWDFVNNDPYPEDTTGVIDHGTSVAGPAAAHTNNGEGIASIGYHTKVVPYKVFGNRNFSTYSMYLSVAYASLLGCKVINLSWGNYAPQDRYYYQYQQDFINFAAVENDAVIVGATFPIEGTFFTTPGDYENVISVLCLYADDTKAIPQATHHWIDLSVPGVDIVTTAPGSQYRTTSGISVGQPLVAGAAALARAKYPWMNSKQIQELLRVTARNIDTIKTNKQHKEKMGHGCLDVFEALTDTLTPAIRLQNYHVERSKGDTVLLRLGFRNYLWPSKNLVLTFRSLSSDILVVDSTAAVGKVAMQDSAATAVADLKFRVLPYDSGDSMALVRVGMVDTATNYSDYQYFYINKNIPKPIITHQEEEEAVEMDVRVYPNPCTAFVVIEKERGGGVVLTDVAGKSLLQETSSYEVGFIDMQPFPAGIYFLKGDGPGGTFTKKIIKK